MDPTPLSTRIDGGSGGTSVDPRLISACLPGGFMPVAVACSMSRMFSEIEVLGVMPPPRTYSYTASSAILFLRTSEGTDPTLPKKFWMVG